jgi:hypothetical protein
VHPNKFDALRSKITKLSRYKREGFDILSRGGKIICDDLVNGVAIKEIQIPFGDLFVFSLCLSEQARNA